ncbi:zinc finger BED domain-containing protein 4-like [Plutella xylostella]|uniref:zinc finger BED domain-containing protein 4-like n=1 Tax=Plutella xylostella TaxID=51655 RepID=UPI002032E43B|nr:zinc finger BED domain-containing protein 4-like [Plutella xylostella]
MPVTDVPQVQFEQPDLLSANTNFRPANNPKPKSSEQLKMDGFTKRPITLSKKAQLDMQLLLMIAKEYQPFNLVNDIEFRKFVTLLNPSYTLPTPKTLSENLLPQQYLKLKQKVKDQLSKALAVCVTTDGWTSDNNESFIGVTAHYIDPETSELCSYLLGCIEYEESHTAENLHQFLREQFKEWDIGHKVGAIVSDNAANILAAIHLSDWRSVSCFAHTLNLIVQTALGCISEITGKVKKIVEFFHRSTTGLNKLKSIQLQMNAPQLKLKQDVITRWNSTYDMLDRATKIKEALIATLALIRQDLVLSAEDWRVIESAVPILKIFYEVTTEISSEKTVSLSKVIVYCRLLSRHIDQRVSRTELEDPTQIKNLLQTLQDQLKKRFKNIETSVLHAESTILDPRFKHRGFRLEQNYEKALADLKTKVGAMRPANTPHLAEPAPPSAIASNTPSATATSGNSIWNEFDTEIANLVPANNTAAGIVEINKYLQEPIINRTLQSPWLNHNHAQLLSD